MELFLMTDIFFLLISAISNTENNKCFLEISNFNMHVLFLKCYLYVFQYIRKFKISFISFKLDDSCSTIQNMQIREEFISLKRLLYQALNILETLLSTALAQ